MFHESVKAKERSQPKPQFAGSVHSVGPFPAEVDEKVPL